MVPSDPTSVGWVESASADHRIKGNPLLYFAYAASIEPARLAEAAPGASFEFIAHLPEWKMEWPISNGDGGLPSVRPLPGNTVWGAVFSVPDEELPAIDDREATEGRSRITAQAMDREGRRHDVVVHVATSTNGVLTGERYI